MLTFNDASNPSTLVHTEMKGKDNIPGIFVENRNLFPISGMD
jgi:hypothetical protein